MKLLIVRHADPDYSIDSLTATGWKEAELLSHRLSRTPADAYYVSPLGRAQDTASLTLKKMGRTAETLKWLQEFSPRIIKPGMDRSSCVWDWLPEVWTKEPLYYDPDGWYNTDAMVSVNAKQEYQWVTEEFDRLLAFHGYKREGMYYHATRPNRDTIVLFCHFGVECVLLSHLMHVSPMPLWHGLCAAPSSVTTIYTEERREGIASFRISAFGDISHLYAAGEKPSFAARFCETWNDKEERHD